MYLSPHVVQKVYTGKQVWGRHITITEWNWIGKFMNCGRYLTKDHVRWSGPWAATMVGRLASSLGRSTPLRASSPCAQYTLFSYVLFYVLNRIGNHMIKQFETWRKDYFGHDLRIDLHNTFPESHATIGNLFLGTPYYLSCCGMRYSRIREHDSWCLVIGEYYFKKKNE
jgi:hypothetical protein